MHRRTVLASAGLALSSPLVGCLDTATPWGETGGISDGTDPAGRDGPSQFQYGPRNTGVSHAEAPASADVRWRTTISPIEGGLAVGDDRVLVAARGSLFALAVDDGEELWEIRVGLDTEAPPTVTDDVAYVTAWNGGPGEDRGVAAIDLADGNERWRAIADVDVRTAPTLADDTLYVGGSLNSEEVIAIDADDGTERWRFPAGQYATAPAVDGGVVYVGGGSEPVVYAIDADDGDEAWRFDAAERMWAAPTVVGDAVYAGSRGGRVYALDRADGDERWSTTLDGAIRDSVAVTDDSVYVPGDGTLAALTLDGDERWSVDTRGWVYAPSVAGDGVVVADRQTAFCLDVADGDERWRHEVHDRAIADVMYSGVGCAPVVADGVVYVGASGGDVYALHDAESDA